MSTHSQSTKEGGRTPPSVPRILCPQRAALRSTHKPFHQALNGFMHLGLLIRQHAVKSYAYQKVKETTSNVQFIIQFETLTVVIDIVHSGILCLSDSKSYLK